MYVQRLMEVESHIRNAFHALDAVLAAGVDDPEAEELLEKILMFKPLVHSRWLRRETALVRSLRELPDPSREETHAGPEGAEYALRELKKAANSIDDEMDHPQLQVIKLIIQNRLREPLERLAVRLRAPARPVLRMALRMRG